MARTKKESVQDPNKLFPKDLMMASTKNGALVESKHRQIVEGACRVFFKKGYHPTTIREIAKSCGMSMGQLYHYISSKDDVLFLVHEHSQELWFEHLENSHIAEIRDPVKRLTEAIRLTLEFMVKNRKLFQFIYTESKHLDKKHLQVVLEMDYKNVIGFWRQQLETLSKNIPSKGDLDFLASLIAYLLVFVPLRGWTLKDKPIEESIRSLEEFLLRGLGAIQ